MRSPQPENTARAVADIDYWKGWSQSIRMSHRPPEPNPSETPHSQSRPPDDIATCKKDSFRTVSLTSRFQTLIDGGIHRTVVVRRLRHQNRIHTIGTRSEQKRNRCKREGQAVEFVSSPITPSLHERRRLPTGIHHDVQRSSPELLHQRPSRVVSRRSRVRAERIYGANARPFR